MVSWFYTIFSKSLCSIFNFLIWTSFPNATFWKRLELGGLQLYPSLKLTARTWKLVVGRWISFWGPAYVQGRTVSFKEGTPLKFDSEFTSGKWMGLENEDECFPFLALGLFSGQIPLNLQGVVWSQLASPSHWSFQVFHLFLPQIVDMWTWLNLLERCCKTGQQQYSRKLNSSKTIHMGWIYALRKPITVTTRIITFLVSRSM